MKKLWLEFIWKIESRLGLWEYQFSNIKTRSIPDFEEIEEEYTSLFWSLILLGDKTNNVRFKRLIEYRTSCIIMWALLWFNKNLEPTTETEKLKEYVEKELQLLIKDGFEINFFPSICGGEENKRRICLANILINFIKIGD